MTTDAPLKALQQALDQPNLDYGRILSLAHDLSRQEEDVVRFSVDASHISRLGIELVSKQETAISELIKNAYDADAITVDGIFKSSDTKGGTLEIIDNGSGMSRSQLLEGFMRISTRDKVAQPTSPKYGRRRAGRKGIGRFAAQRLGRRLHIATQLDGADHALELRIDWEQFEGGVDLHEIANQILVVEPKSTPGTTLVISDLRDSWSEVQIRRAFRYVSDLLQPFPLSLEEPLDDKHQPDPGFKVAFYKEQSGDLLTIASDEKNILAHASAHITANVDEVGKGDISVTSTRYNVDVEDAQLSIKPSTAKTRVMLTDKKYDLLAGVKLTAHYFIQEDLPTGARGLVRDVLTQRGGVRVYRNGFRVLPYGEAFNDWLGLQRSSALRELLPPHHNTNFIGFVELTDVAGKRFEETASREGLLENEAFHQLQDFCYRALVTAVIGVARARGKKLFSSDERMSPLPGSPKTEPTSPKAKALQVADRLRSLVDEPLGSPSSERSSDTQGTISDLANQIEAIGLESENSLEEVGMLRVLASLGLTIGEFTHEVRHALAALGASIDTISSESEGSAAASSLTEHMLLLRSYMRYFDDAVTQNAHRSLEVHELRDLLNEFVEVVQPSLIRQGVKVDVKFEGYDLFTRPMHKSEWASIFLNLFTNALKAIHRANTAGHISIKSGVLDDSLFVEFSDNGDGVPEEHREQIFDAFFTTSSPPGALAAHSEQLVGTGLGLKIVRDIIEAVGGEIELVDPPAGFSTCFRLSVPRAREDQIGDARY